MANNKTAQVCLATLDALSGVLGIAPGELLLREIYDQAGGLDEVTFMHAGHTYVCKVDPGPVAAGRPARVVNPHWRVTRDGHDLGRFFDFDAGDTSERVVARVLAELPRRPFV